MSKLPDNIAQPHFQCARQPQQHIDRGNFVPALDLPHIDRVDINSLRKYFLRQARPLAVFANTPAQKFAIFFCDHDRPLSQPVFGGIAQILLAIILFSLDDAANLWDEGRRLTGVIFFDRKSGV